MKLIAGNSNKDLAGAIAHHCGQRLTEVELIKFADNELSCMIKENVRGEDVFIIQSTSNPANDHLMELLIIIDACKRASAGRITAVIPYFGYARQDREFLDGEIVSISVIGKLLRSVGAKKIITVDIHSKMALQQLKISSENVTAITELVKYFKKKKLKNPLIVSPDLGGKQRAEKFASLMNADCIALKKNRNRKTGQVEILTKNVDVKDCDLILVDDIISTGGSIIKSAQFLKKQKCKRVFVACTHALLVNNAENKIKKVFLI